MTDRPSVLVPVRILKGESIPEGIPDLLANAHVVLLGYHVVPDQTATDQARAQFEDQALRQLEEFEAILEHAGATVETQLVFTHHGQQTIDRLIDERDCVAVLIPNATRPIESVLVAIRGTVGLDRFVTVLSGLYGDTDIEITLLHVASEETTDEDAETLLEGVATRLTENGVGVADIRVERDGKSQAVITETAAEFDALVMGESDPSVTTFVFGMRAQQVADQFLGPVFVVQREKPATREDE